MLYEHNGHSPHIAESSFVAPNAVICGDVTIGKNCRIMYGATLIAEGGSIVIGDNCVILENAVIRSTARHNLSIGSNVLVGPNTHLVGCVIEDNVFVATGASVFHGAVLSSGCEVRINGVVHVMTNIAKDGVVPIGWVAVGNPAQIFSPDRHEEIANIQSKLNFPMVAYGLEREYASMPNITAVMTKMLGTHLHDQEIEYEK